MGADKRPTQGYANHAFRYYFLDPRPEPRDKATALNVEAVETALNRMPRREVETLRRVYTSSIFPMRVAVAAVAAEFSVDPWEVWRVVRLATRRFSEARGL